MGGIGSALARHPGITTMAVSSAALIGVASQSDDGKVGSLNVQQLASASIGVGVLVGLFGGHPASAMGYGLAGAGLLTHAAIETGV